MKRLQPLFLLIFFLLFCCFALYADDSLPYWISVAAKKALLTFVADVIKQGGPKYVEPDKRIVTFDNDGTLWAEQPIYVQLAFGIDRVKALAPQHPEWKTQEPFKSVLEG